VADSSLGYVAQAGKLEEHSFDQLSYLSASQSAIHLNASKIDYIRAVGVGVFGEPPEGVAIDLESVPHGRSCSSLGLFEMRGIGGTWGFMCSKEIVSGYS
jgi:hypothetical protein